MERVLQRDAAWKPLYDRYGRPYTPGSPILQQPASAEEIVQDVFLQLWKNADQYQISRGPLGPGAVYGCPQSRARPALV